MPKPPPDNLAKRQYDLNTRVNEAFTKRIKFDNIKDEKENSDVDKFFKIDLASKCKNVEYIIEVLKSWETLYVRRALAKCQWLYGDEYSKFINPEFLHDNIFPTTSMRAKRLILKTVAMNVRKEDRAEAFFNYCIKAKLTDIAFKCLLFTSEEFKLDLLQNHNKQPFNKITNKKLSYIRFIIGKSFSMLEAYMKMLTNDKYDSTIRKFRYLYLVDNLKYLDLIEKYLSTDSYKKNEYDTKFCESVMRKYKERVLAKPLFYMKIIHEDIIFRHITVDDAKIFIVALLPPTPDSFWDSWFCENDAKRFVKLIPQSEVLNFIKKIFHDKYPNVEFETKFGFYEQRYYEFMTVKQQEEWAVNQIKSDRQVLGVGNDYMWYRFINFEEAFKEIKTYANVTKDPERRTDMFNTLVMSVRNDRELERLFKYYSKRHINEQKIYKERFLNAVIAYQNVFEFDDACWSSFYSLFLSTQLFKKGSNQEIDMTLEDYKTVTLFYHILNEKEILEPLMIFLLEDFRGDGDIEQHLKKLDKKKRQFLFNYLHKFYTDKIIEFKNKPYSRLVKSNSERYFSVLVKLTYKFNVYQETYNEKNTCVRKPRTSTKKEPVNFSQKLLQELKTKDVNLVISKLPELKNQIKTSNNINLNNFFRKIKIYFHIDIVENILTMCENILSEIDVNSAATNTSVYAIFKLGNENRKVNLMKKYVPENSEINYCIEETQKLITQKAICRYAASSLPPVPLAEMLNYLKGDYVPFCAHIFGVYIAALPMSMCIKLVQKVLDSPVSIQKHALRLAFECVNADNLKNISEDIWKKTNNVSLRSVIYKALFNRIIDKNESELHDVLISFTIDLRDDDQGIIFRLALVESDSLSKDYIGKYIQATWKSIGSFKDREPNISRKRQVIYGIRRHLDNADKEFVRSIINEHLDTMFVENKLHLNYNPEEDIASLYKEKWNLTIDFIFNGACKDELNNEYAELTQFIVEKCLEKWNDIHSGAYIYQLCCWKFIKTLNIASTNCNIYAECLIPLFEKIIDVLNAALPLYEIYLKNWELQLVIANRKVVKDSRKNIYNEINIELLNELAMKFGKEVGELVLKHIDTKTYYRTFSEKIAFEIRKRVGELLKIIVGPTDEEFKNHFNVALLTVSMSLIDIETAETFILAALILPTEEQLNEKYIYVLNAVMKYPDPEVQSIAYRKSAQATESIIHVKDKNKNEKEKSNKWNRK